MLYANSIVLSQQVDGDVADVFLTRTGLLTATFVTTRQVVWIPLPPDYYDIYDIFNDIFIYNYYTYGRGEAIDVTLSRYTVQCVYRKVCINPPPCTGEG